MVHLKGHRFCTMVAKYRNGAGALSAAPFLGAKKAAVLMSLCEKLYFLIYREYNEKRTLNILQHCRWIGVLLWHLTTGVEEF